MSILYVILEKVHLILNLRIKYKKMNIEKIEQYMILFIKT
ncbi:hypothetical protein GUU_00632 [Malacoplasma iowae 695]|nr:hypothetical protein GUU_00632 [Malacoplasma iowae 695]